MRYRRVTVPSHKTHGFVRCVTDALPARYRPVPQKLWFRQARYRRATVPSYKNYGSVRCVTDALLARYRPVQQKLWFREVRYRRVTGALPPCPAKVWVRGGR